jgi:hypothetical protein
MAHMIVMRHKTYFYGVCRLYAPQKYGHSVAHGIISAKEMSVSMAHISKCTTEIWWDPPLSQGA